MKNTFWTALILLTFCKAHAKVDTFPFKDWQPYLKLGVEVSNGEFQNNHSDQWNEGLEITLGVLSRFSIGSAGFQVIFSPALSYGQNERITGDEIGLYSLINQDTLWVEKGTLDNRQFSAILPLGVRYILPSTGWYAQLSGALGFVLYRDLNWDYRKGYKMETYGNPTTYIPENFKRDVTSKWGYGMWSFGVGWAGKNLELGAYLDVSGTTLQDPVLSSFHEMSVGIQTGFRI